MSKGMEIYNMPINAVRTRRKEARLRETKKNNQEHMIKKIMIKMKRKI